MEEDEEEKCFEHEKLKAMIHSSCHIIIRVIIQNTIVVCMMMMMMMGGERRQEHKSLRERERERSMCNIRNNGGSLRSLFLVFILI